MTMPDPAPPPPGSGNGRLLVVSLIGAALWVALAGVVFGYNTRWAVHIEALDRRLSELERRAGIEPQALPRR